MGTREQKAEVVGVVKERFDRATAVVLVDFAGIDVPAITELRARFRAAGVEYKVVKNRLIKQALKGSKYDGHAGLAKSLTGMTGVAWSFEDPSAAAKIITKFRKEHEDHEKLQVKGGLMEGEFLTGQRVEQELATLPGKDELRAMLLATMMAPAQSLVRQVAAPAQNLVYVLDARRRQLEGGEG
ncbi:MAG: 50S ribosomal protein L10 [Sandaracinaceae bacterium]|nr:50S ribosomal protein L10 [Sandaracinaceae bacterium]